MLLGHRSRFDRASSFGPCSTLRGVKPNESILDLLLELQTLDRVPRMGFALRGVAVPESVAEHSFHVATLVWVLAREERGIDTLRALELAIVHDLAEVRTGDLPMTAGRYLPDGAKATGERAAFDELLAPLGSHGRQLLDELADQESTEARFVKACDKLQLMLKVAVYEGWGSTGLGEFWENDDNFREGEFARVDRLFAELRTRHERSASA